MNQELHEFFAKEEIEAPQSSEHLPLSVDQQPYLGTKFSKGTALHSLGTGDDKVDILKKLLVAYLSSVEDYCSVLVVQISRSPSSSKASLYLQQLASVNKQLSSITET